MPSAPAVHETLVVLDMDGVLLHLKLQTEQLRQRFQQLFAEHGIERPFRPLLDSLKQACAEIAVEDSQLAQQLQHQAWALIDEEELRAAHACQPASGAASLLTALRPYQVALFTNNGQAAAEAALQQAGLDASQLITVQARKGPQSIKPAAEPILDALEQAGGPKQIKRIIMLGDHPADMRSASLARAALAQSSWQGEVIPIGLRGARDQELEQEGAWFLAADLAEAATLITTAAAPLSLAMVLLAFNEEDSIKQAIVDARRFGQTFLDDYEIIVVDDGSSDRTAERAEATSVGDVTVVRHGCNRGMGAAMRTGYLAASKDYLVHLPADRQVRPQALAPLLAEAAPQRVALTSYHAPPSGRQRQWVSWIFRLLVHHIGGLQVNFAGTYIFHRQWLPLLKGDAVGSDSFLLSFQLLQQLKRRGCTMIRRQIHNFPRYEGTSREFALRRITKMAEEILHYRLRQLRG